MCAAMREVYGREPSLQGEGGSIPLCNVLQEAHPAPRSCCSASRSPRCRIHAPDESVDPAEIETVALVEALFLQRLAANLPAT
jgi:cysteinylglycine-S-conjugate dipeptidase